MSENSNIDLNIDIPNWVIDQDSFKKLSVAELIALMLRCSNRISHLTKTKYYGNE